MASGSSRAKSTRRRVSPRARCSRSASLPMKPPVKPPALSKLTVKAMPASVRETRVAEIGVGGASQDLARAGSHEPEGRVVLRDVAERDARARRQVTADPVGIPHALAAPGDDEEGVGAEARDREVALVA